MLSLLRLMPRFVQVEMKKKRKKKENESRELLASHVRVVVSQKERERKRKGKMWYLIVSCVENVEPAPREIRERSNSGLFCLLCFLFVGSCLLVGT